MHIYAMRNVVDLIYILDLFPWKLSKSSEVHSDSWVGNTDRTVHHQHSNDRIKHMTGYLEHWRWCILIEIKFSCTIIKRSSNSMMKTL